MNKVQNIVEMHKDKDVAWYLALVKDQNTWYLGLVKDQNTKTSLVVHVTSLLEVSSSIVFGGEN